MTVRGASSSNFRLVTVSIVSHGHGRMVSSLIRSILACCEVGQVILTLNISELIEIPDDGRLHIIRNDYPKGFGANHNSAFQICNLPFFCPLNPDIGIESSPFTKLLEVQARTGAAIVAPLVLSPQGGVEDSARRFPTMLSVLAKLLLNSDGRYALSAGNEPFNPEWVAGMFMMFCSESFHRLGGFDERFFLYYEDVDICVRTWRNNMSIVLCPGVSVIHAAQRESHRNWRYLRWHLASMARYFYKHWGRLPKVYQRVLLM